MPRTPTPHVYEGDNYYRVLVVDNYDIRRDTYPEVVKWLNRHGFNYHDICYWDGSLEPAWAEDWVNGNSR